MVDTGARATSLTRLFLMCAAAAGPAFITVFLLEGARRDGYQQLRHPVSALSLGPDGWAQVTSFGATGMMYVAGGVGLCRVPDPVKPARLGPALIGAAGLGLIGSAMFATEPVSGYPPEALGASGSLDRPESKDVPLAHDAAMTRHGIAAIPMVMGLPLAALAYAWRFHRHGNRRWAGYSSAAAASMSANFVLAAAGFGQHRRLVHVAGLFQRASIISAFAWITALALRALDGLPRIDQGQMRSQHDS
ncbi:MAG TPA: DUF998 domain-containing protein [Dermatophilaceae bacterium]|nr:DUF998 domain-containing protein [Dermatophilaceae bacterium]